MSKLLGIVNNKKKDSRYYRQVLKLHVGFLQSLENWDGDGDMAGYSGGEGYSESGLEEQGEAEVQGVSIGSLCLHSPRK